MNETNGVVIKVVTSVISTKITNTEGVNIPISYPIVNTTSSIKPTGVHESPYIETILPALTHESGGEHRSPKLSCDGHDYEDKA